MEIGSSTAEAPTGRQYPSVPNVSFVPRQIVPPQEFEKLSLEIVASGDLARDFAGIVHHGCRPVGAYAEWRWPTYQGLAPPGY